MNKRDAKIVAATLTIVGAILSILDRIYTPDHILLEGSPNYPDILRTIGWLFLLIPPLIYIALDWRGLFSPKKQLYEGAMTKDNGNNKKLMQHLISPNFDSSKFDSGKIDDLIDVLEDRMQNWLFRPINVLCDNRKGIMAALGLELTYFEGITIFKRGEDSDGRSEKFFKEGFVDVLKASGHSQELLNRIGKIVYKEARCGFMHDGFVRGKVQTSFDTDGDLSITVPLLEDGLPDYKGEIKSIVINPRLLCEAIERHFNNYVAELRNSSNRDLRDAFMEACKMKWGLEEPPVIIGMDGE